MKTNKRHLYRTNKDFSPKAVGLDSEKLKGKEVGVLCFIWLCALLCLATIIFEATHIQRTGHIYIGI